MVWMPWSDDDPLKKYSDKWISEIPQHVIDAAVGLVRSGEKITVPTLMAAISLNYGITMARSAAKELLEIFNYDS